MSSIQKCVYMKLLDSADQTHIIKFCIKNFHLTGLTESIPKHVSHPPLNQIAAFMPGPKPSCCEMNRLSPPNILLKDLFMVKVLCPKLGTL